MGGVTHRFVEANGLKIHIAEQGSGPLVLLLHGFPESWYSWRHQLPALAAAGFHAVAPDLRGFGDTKGPQSPEEYTGLHQVADVVGLLDALGEKQVFVVGHDWGATHAWDLCLMRPAQEQGPAVVRRTRRAIRAIAPAVAPRAQVEVAVAPPVESDGAPEVARVAGAPDVARRQEGDGAQEVAHVAGAPEVARRQEGDSAGPADSIEQGGGGGARPVDTEKEMAPH